MQTVAKQVLADLTNSFWLVKRCIMFNNPGRTYMKLLISMPLFNALRILEILYIFSNIKSKQWAAHGVLINCGRFASNNLPINKENKYTFNLELN